ncbi:MAG TPA: hypothetical protein VHV83_10200 [Armatimonadota bacterium]|nr:hypothetical protein [Armatimonadota bacterium]
MTPTGAADQYAASIPGPSAIGDIYHYYITATDSARAQNAARSPAAENYVFYIAAPVTGVVGATTSSINKAGYSCGNSFLCTTTSVLNQIEQWLYIYAPIELRFVVYESTSLHGTYSKISETVIPDSGTGQRWYSSGPISVPMVAGRYYAVGATSDWNVYYYYQSSGHSQEAGFGVSKYGYMYEQYPPQNTLPSPSSPQALRQRLTSTLLGRIIEMEGPSGGTQYEPGTLLPMRWTASGSRWLPSDTVSFSYSADGGNTWNAIADAADVPYDAGTWNWDTTGVPESSHYRLKVTSNADPSVSNSFGYDFSVMVDNVPPAIIHTPPVNTNQTSGPYTITANVTDNVGLSSVLLYYSRNGEPYASVAMTDYGVGIHMADIPEPRTFGDVYHYYFVATDTARTQNTTRDPSAGEYTLNITHTVIDTMGSAAFSTTNSGYCCGNVFSCSTTSSLDSIEHYLNITTSTELRFFVYEAATLTGTYNKIFELVQPSSGTGVGWYSSGPIHVPLVAGRYYIIGTGWQGTVTWYYAPTGGQKVVSFGQGQNSFQIHAYPPPNTTNRSTTTSPQYQRLTSTPMGRTLTITCPNGGEQYEPDTSIAVRWTATGDQWDPSETIRLEYSADSGTTWNRIAPAVNIPYETGAYNWNITGLPQGSQYKMRIALNDDDFLPLYDTSDGTFAIMTDNTPPVVAHTPPMNTADRTGPYTVRAIVTDNVGLSRVNLSYNKNGSTYSTVSMTPSGTANEYTADIPGPSAFGDNYRYHLTAIDAARMPNTARAPESADYVFNVMPLSIDSVGGTNSTGTGSGYCRGNLYSCTTSSTLYQIEQYLSPSVSTELSFFVYESTSLTGTYTKIMEKIVPSSGTGVRWYTSGQISVPLVAGRYYVIGVGYQNSVVYYYRSGGHPTTVAFGTSENGYSAINYPPQTSISKPSSTNAYYQRLTTYPSTVENATDLADLKSKKGTGNLVRLTGSTVITYAPRNSADARTTPYFYIGEIQGLGCIRVVDMNVDDLIYGRAITGLTGRVTKSDSTGEYIFNLTADPVGNGDDVVPPLTSITPLGISNKVSMIDPLIPTNLVTVWGQVNSIAGDRTSFTISDGYKSELTIMVNNVPLPMVFDTTKYAVVSGILTKDTDGNRIILAQEVRTEP